MYLDNISQNFFVPGMFPGVVYYIIHILTRTVSHFHLYDIPCIAVYNYFNLLTSFSSVLVIFLVSISFGIDFDVSTVDFGNLSSFSQISSSMVKFLLC